MHIRYILLVSVYIFYSQCSQYQENAEYDDLLQNVIKRLETFKRDEISHHSSQRSINNEKYLAHNFRRSYNRYDNDFNQFLESRRLNERRSKLLDYVRAVKSSSRNVISPVNDVDDEVDENLADIEEEKNSHSEEEQNNNNVEQNNNNNEEHETVTHSIKMPNVAPEKQDTYLCYAHKLPSDDRYIVEFNPAAKQQIAHHMLLFGCRAPWQAGKVWNCREMAPICKGGQSIMYAWAKNAPSLKMPKDVGFHVGGKSGINYLVLQVHYLDVSSFKEGNTDSSGLTFELSSIRPHYFAGIYLLADGFTNIPPRKQAAHIDMGCDYTNAQSLPPKIFPFRFRVHAHKLGAVITGYRVRDGKWTLIGRGDPQRPQAFYKVFNDVDIREGDKVYGRCTYNSTGRSRVTRIGATHKDEMCNFYIMYFYEQPRHSPNAAANLPCGYTSIDKLDWPTDSDTTLAVMEERNHETSNEDTKKHQPALFTQANDWPIHGNETGNLPLTVGQIAGVAYDEKNERTVVFQRGSRVWGYNTFVNDSIVNRKWIPENTLLWLDQDGSIVKYGGARMFSMPHGITIDGEGNIWVTDVGTHQVFKLKGDSLEVLLSVGVQFKKGDAPDHFCKPTDVAVMQDGSFFVADGYCNGRVVKFTSNGKLDFIIDAKDFKNTYSFPKPFYMNVVHSLALDEEKHRLYVADRENQRVLVFNSNDGTFVSHIRKGTFKGAVYAIAFARLPDVGAVLHVINGPVMGKFVKISGYTYSLEKSAIISKWAPNKGFHYPHDIAVTKDNRHAFVSEIGPNKIWKFNSKIREAYHGNRVSKRSRP